MKIFGGGEGMVRYFEGCRCSGLEGMADASVKGFSICAADMIWRCIPALEEKEKVQKLQVVVARTDLRVSGSSYPDYVV